MIMNPQSEKHHQQFLTINQVAEHLNISRRSVYTLIDQGLPYAKVGGHKRIALSSLHWWFASKEYSTNPEIQMHLEEQCVVMLPRLSPATVPGPTRKKYDQARVKTAKA